MEEDEMSFKRGSFDHDPYSSTPEGELLDMFQAGKNRGELKVMPMTDVYLPLHPVHGVVDKGEYPISELFIHRPDYHWHIGFFFIDLELDGPYHRAIIS
jgi:hypothetical protein